MNLEKEAKQGQGQGLGQGQKEESLKKEPMPFEARRTLVRLLRQGVILARQQAKTFESVCRYKSYIKKHLKDVYLRLVLDDRAGVAFVATLDADEEMEEMAEMAEMAEIPEEEGRESSRESREPVSLISRRTLSLYDTLLLLVLRKHYQKREASAEQQIMIDVESIESHLSPFLPLTNSTQMDRKRLNTALHKMTERHILSGVRGDEDRFEITPLIRYVVKADFLENMLKEYGRLARENSIQMGETGETAEATETAETGETAEATETAETAEAAETAKATEAETEQPR